MEVRIEYLEEKILFGKHISTNFLNDRTPELWAGFMPLRKHLNNVVGTALYSVQVYPSTFSFENIDPTQPFDKWAMVEVEKGTAAMEGMETLVLPAGLYAVFNHIGGPATAEKSFRYIFSDWLPASGFETDQRPHFELITEKYKGNAPDSEEDIFIPIRPKSAVTDRYRHNLHTWDQLTDVYVERFMDLPIYNKSYDRFLELLPKHGADVLEFGCGPGNVSRYLMNKSPDIRLLATDISEQMVNKARELVKGPEFRLLDARSCHSLNQLFDGILAGFILPYLEPEDTENFVKECYRLLQPEGIFYLSVIEGEPHLSGYQSGSNKTLLAYVNYYSEAMLSNYLTKAGFEAIECMRVEYPKGEKTEIHLVVIGKKSI